MEDVPIEETKGGDGGDESPDNIKKETLDEDENVTAEVFENTNNLVEDGRET